MVRSSCPSRISLPLNPQPITCRKNTGVERVGGDAGRIRSDLSREDLREFKSKEIGDEKQIKFDYDIEIAFGDRVGTILFRTKVGGRLLGDTSIEFLES